MTTPIPPISAPGKMAELNEAAARRLRVLQSHLAVDGSAAPAMCASGKDSAVSSSAPMSSSKAEVQKAFPKHRWARCSCMIYRSVLDVSSPSGCLA